MRKQLVCMGLFLGLMSCGHTHYLSAGQTPSFVPQANYSYVVTSDKDDGGPSTLRSLIQQAKSEYPENVDDTIEPALITFDPKVQRIELETQINIPSGLKLIIRGNKNERQIITNKAKVCTRFFLVEKSAHLILANAIITGGKFKSGTSANGAGIAVATSGQLDLDNIYAYKNVSNSNGGFLSNTGVTNINNSIIAENYARSYGGGIYNGNILNINNSEIKENTAKHGGGIYSMHIQNLYVNSSNFIENTAKKDGNAIYYFFDSNGIPPRIPLEIPLEDLHFQDEVPMPKQTSGD